MISGKVSTRYRALEYSTYGDVLTVLGGGRSSCELLLQVHHGRESILLFIRKLTKYLDHDLLVFHHQRGIVVTLLGGKPYPGRRPDRYHNNIRISVVWASSNRHKSRHAVFGKQEDAFTQS